MMGIEDHVAWVTPHTFTVENVPCSEDGKMCGGEVQGHSGGKKMYVSQVYLDPSVKFLAKKGMEQANLRVNK